MMKSNKIVARCSNCSHKLEDSFCTKCGQKNTISRTGWLDILKALASGLLSMERGIFGTLRDVIRDPKKVVEVYWAGGRHYYQSPGQMIFFVILVLGLHILFVDSRILGFQVQLTNVPEAYRGFFNPQLLFVALVLPFMALTSRIYFFRKKRSFPEHFIGAVYIFSTWAITLTIVSDVFSLFIDFRPEIIVLIFLALIFIWNSRVYTNGKVFLRSVLNSIIQLLIFTLILLSMFSAIILIGIGESNYTIDY